MKWILTLEASTQRGDLREALEKAGSTLDEDTPMIPVEHDTTVEVEGPADLPRRLRNVPGIKAVHPSSDLTLY